MIRTPLRPLARILSARQKGENPDTIERENLRLRHEEIRDKSRARAEVLRSVRRVADKLLHEPTVRVRELANETGAVSYAAALAELFALDPDAVEAVTRPEGLS